MADLPPDDAPSHLIEVRRNPDGSLDEIVAENCAVHLEQMDDGVWWLAVEKGGYRQATFFSAVRRKGKLRIHANSECDDWPESADG